MAVPRGEGTEATAVTRGGATTATRKARTVRRSPGEATSRSRRSPAPLASRLDDILMPLARFLTSRLRFRVDARSDGSDAGTRLGSFPRLDRGPRARPPGQGGHGVAPVPLRDALSGPRPPPGGGYSSGRSPAADS